jgi:hypothetical protein
MHERAGAAVADAAADSGAIKWKGQKEFGALRIYCRNPGGRLYFKPDNMAHTQTKQRNQGFGGDW